MFRDLAGIKLGVYPFATCKLTALKKHSRILAKYLLVVSVLGSAPAWSQNLSHAEAAQKAREATNGKVLKVKKTNSNTINYRVKILSPEGRVKHILIDGNTGEVRSRKKN